MIKSNLKSVILLACIALLVMSCSEPKKSIDLTGVNLDQNGFKHLNTGWKLKRAQDITANGGEIASVSSVDNSWIDAVVPGTIMHSLIESGRYNNIYFKENLAKVNVDSVFVPWVYFKEFNAEEGWIQNNGSLFLDGINYKANIWLNGELIADTNKIDGAFRRYEISVSGKVNAGDNNLVIEVLPPKNGAYSVGFVDWAPTPPDRNMGIWRAVKLKFTTGVAIQNTYVHSKLDLEKFESAELTLETELKNNSKTDEEVKLSFLLNGDTLNYSTVVKAESISKLKLTSAEIAGLKINKPKLWWPVGYGDPNLYSLVAKATTTSGGADKEEIQFGIREVSDYLNDEGHRGYIVNGEKVLIKGAGWVDELFLRDTKEFDENQMQYVKDMNMNCVRFEGFWGKNEDLYQLCDEYGLLAMVGFSCHWEWADYIGTPCGDKFGCAEEDHEIDLLASYWHDQIKWLRNHPSIYVWVGGSDFLPHPDLEKKYLAILKDVDPSRPYLGAAKWHTSSVTGPSAVKMEGPYDYVSPNYWYTDTMRGGAFGFNTETGPGPQPPVLASIYKMYGKDVNFPIDSTWDYHCGRHAFGNMNKYLKAFNARYGESKTLEDFALLSQMASYEAIRPMYESFRVNKPNTTGIIQWMLNSAWPETFWQLYDYYLHPNGAYFGIKKACEPIQAIYNYGNHTVSVVNETRMDEELTLNLELFNVASESVLKIDTTFKVTSDGIFNLGALPAMDKNDVELLFMDLKKGGVELASNNYWLSKKPDVVDPDYKNSSWIYTPNIDFADLTSLRSLEAVELEYALTNSQGVYSVSIKNTTDKIAYAIELTAIAEGNGEPILPVLWSDNYLVLKPGEEQVVQLTFPNISSEKVNVSIKGFNTNATILK